MSIAGFRASNHPQQTAKRGATDDVDDRATTPEMFGPLRQRFGFTLDVAASPHNAKCERYFTRDDDGLTQPWSGERVWCNPPYSDIGAWVRKAWAEWESARRPLTITMLLPANRTEQGWWQDHVEPYRLGGRADFQVEFLRGRPRFIRPSAVIGPKGDRPPFGCCLLIWGHECRCDDCNSPDPNSETPGPGEGDLRGEVPLHRIARVLREQGIDWPHDQRMTLASLVLDAAVEQRTLAEQKVARVEALCDEYEAKPYGEQLLAASTLRAALADPEADR